MEVVSEKPHDEEISVAAVHRFLFCAKAGYYFLTYIGPTKNEIIRTSNLFQKLR